MAELETKHPTLHKMFTDGFHVVRRSDRYWGGLSTDLTIEQVLMKSLKSTGGLTRGSGMTELQCASWVLSMPACADINRKMQEFIGQDAATTNTHPDASDARMKRDLSDI